MINLFELSHAIKQSMEYHLGIKLSYVITDLLAKDIIQYSIEKTKTPTQGQQE